MDAPFKYFVIRLVHTPEAKVTKSGKDVCTFSIACDRQSGGQKETDFFNCTAFGNTAPVSYTHLDVYKRQA